jgi:hypothetical protein
MQLSFVQLSPDNKNCIRTYEVFNRKSFIKMCILSFYTSEVFVIIDNGIRKKGRCEMSKKIGIDAGNSAVKIATERTNTITPAFIASGSELRDYGDKEYKKDQRLDVIISSEANKINGRYFVGKLAYNERRTRLIERNQIIPKAEDDVLLITEIVATAFHLLEENPNISTEYIELYASLPIAEYFDTQKNYKEIFEKRLKTTHTIKFLDPAFKGAEVKLIVNNVKILPEGIGAFYTFIKNEEDLKKNRVLIDIGRFTTDILFFENGEFQRNGFIGINEGISNPMGEIQKYLQDEIGIDYSYFQIDNAIRNKDKKIKAYGKTYEIGEITDKAFRNFAMFIESKLSEKVKQNAIDMSQLDDILLTGGGAILMSNYIGIQKMLKGLDVIYNENPIMSNAIGNLKLAEAEAKISKEEDNEDII